MADNSQEETTIEQESSFTTPTDEIVRQVAKLLAGKSLVLIGGKKREEAMLAIQKAFGLKSVEWVATKRHESYRNFERFIARSEVAVVLLMTRWANHSFKKVKVICEQHGKAFVMLPGGYNPNQIASAIQSQVSRRLQ